MSTRLHTVLTEVRIGDSVWSSMRKHSDNLLVGGVVVAMESIVDHETGEVRKVFRTVDPYRRAGAVHLLSEAEIDLGNLEMADYSRLNMLIRRMAEDVSKGRGSMLPEHAQLVDWMHALLRESAA